MKVRDKGLAGEGSRRRSRMKAWLEMVLDEGLGRRRGWRRFSTKVQDEGLAGEGSRRMFGMKAWPEKVLHEGPG